eukprot:757334-Hanusia_phi.AAC.5
MPRRHNISAMSGRRAARACAGPGSAPDEYRAVPCRGRRAAKPGVPSDLKLARRRSPLAAAAALSRTASGSAPQGLSPVITVT